MPPASPTEPLSNAKEVPWVGLSGTAQQFLVLAAMLTSLGFASLGFAYRSIRGAFWVAAAASAVIATVRRRARTRHAFLKLCPNNGYDAPYIRFVRTRTVFVGYVCSKGD